MISPLAGVLLAAAGLASRSAGDPPAPEPARPEQTAATPPPAETTGSAVVLSMQIPEDGSGDFDERLERALRAHADESGVRVEPSRYVPEALDLATLPSRSQRVVRETPATSVVWVLRSEHGAAVVLFEGETGRLFLRETEPNASDSLLVETVVNIAMSVALALESGDPQQLDQLEEISVDALTAPPPEPAAEPLEPPSPETPPSEPAPLLAAQADGPEPATAPPRPSAHPARVWLGAAYFGTTFADSIPWQHGIALRARWRALPRFSLLLGYDVVFPSDARLDDIAFTLRRHPLRLGAGTRFPVASRVDVAADASVVVDPIRRRAASTQGVTDDTLRTFVAGAGQAGVGIHLAPRIRFGVDVGLQVLLTRARYVARQPGETGDSVSLQPHRARVTVGAGLEVGLGPRRKKAESG